MLVSSSRIRSSHQKCFIKKAFFKILENSQENTCVRVSFLIKLQAEICYYTCRLRSATLFKKETMAQVFSCKFCETFKNSLFTEHSLRILFFGRMLLTDVNFWIILECYMVFTKVLVVITNLSLVAISFLHRTKVSSTIKGRKHLC